MIQTVIQIDPSCLISCPAKQRDMRGFTLIEMMIALVILSVSILGMTSLTLTSIRVNMENDLRNAAVRVTTEVAEDLGALPIDEVITGTETRQVIIRGGNYAFTVARNVSPLTNDLRQVDITVSYTHRGITQTNSAVVYKHRAS